MTGAVVPRLLLYPGAGSSSDHSSLVAIADAVAPRTCIRAEFAYRKAGRRAPDRAPVLMQAVLDEVVGLGPGPLVLGGRSMGGRICSMVVADRDNAQLVDAVGLVLVSYPLHPPGKPDTLRVEHLVDIDVPCLFVSGTRDEFATPDELQHWSATIPGEVTHIWIDGGRHDLARADRQVAEAVASWLDGRFAQRP